MKVEILSRKQKGDYVFVQVEYLEDVNDTKAGEKATHRFKLFEYRRKQTDADVPTVASIQCLPGRRLDIQLKNVQWADYTGLIVSECVPIDGIMVGRELEGQAKQILMDEPDSRDKGMAAGNALTNATNLSIAYMTCYGAEEWKKEFGMNGIGMYVRDMYRLSFEVRRSDLHEEKRR